MEARGEPINSARTFAIWLGRVVANAVLGGLAFAAVGAFCGGGVGGLFGALSYHFRVDATLVGAKMGVYAGLASGVVGVLIYAIAAFGAAPGALLAPFRRLAKRVSLGQIAGTLLACASFAAFEFGKATLQGLSFAQALDTNDGFYAVCAAPAVMICGAIAGALWRRAPQ